jgi:hypothetical protein
MGNGDSKKNDQSAKVKRNIGEWVLLKRFDWK